ncbi:hypothetical protein VNN36_08075 [Lactococcus garvieae]|uniref:hypothetical protein n=1 Tax=Lactococcus garvieae TaxID=1363 RepID=UPI0030D40B9E
MSKLNEGEVLTKLTGMLNDSYMQGYQDALDIKTKLSIPKKVAEELDTKFADIHVLDLGYVLDQTGPYGSPGFDNNYFKNKDAIAAYMISKALGVELVEVEG